MSIDTPDLQALIELSEKATPGPWSSHASVSDRGGWDNPRQTVSIGSEETLVASYDTSFSEYPDDVENAANAAFIAALVNWFRANHSTLTATTPPAAASDFSDALHTAVCNAVILLNNGEEIAPRVSSILREALFNYAPPVAASIAQQGGVEVTDAMVEAALSAHHPMHSIYYPEEEMRAALTAALAQQPAACPKCDGTGEADSGGIHPWGAPATIPCDCQQPAAEAQPVACPKCKSRGYFDDNLDVDDEGRGIGTVESCPECYPEASPPSAPVGVEGLMQLARNWCLAWGEWAHDADPGCAKENAAEAALRAALTTALASKADGGES